MYEAQIKTIIIEQIGIIAKKFIQKQFTATTSRCHRKFFENC